MEVLMQTKRNRVEIDLDLPTPEQATALARATWTGIDAGERLDMELESTYQRDAATGPISLEQLGTLTKLADDLAAGATELAARAERIRTHSLALSRS